MTDKYKEFKRWLASSKYSFKTCCYDISYSQVFKEFEYEDKEREIKDIILKQLKSPTAVKCSQLGIDVERIWDMECIVDFIYDELKEKGYI